MKDTGFFLICVTMIIIISAIAFSAKKGKMNSEFDERQELARGKAFRAAYFTLLGYLVISEIISSSLNREWCNGITNLGFGVSISLTVFAMVCIIKDAYIGFNQKTIRNIVIQITIGVFNMFFGICSLIENHEYVTDDTITSIPLNLPMGVLLIVVAITLFIKTLHDRSEAE